MAFTYTDSLSTNRDKVRFHIQDVTEDSGPKPDDANFSDNEINGLVTIEGSWQAAVAACFETLAGLWAREVDITVGPRREAFGQVAKRYGALAKEWRDRYGPSTGAAGSRHLTRVDGYSSDVSADET